MHVFATLLPLRCLPEFKPTRFCPLEFDNNEHARLPSSSLQSTRKRSAKRNRTFIHRLLYTVVHLYTVSGCLFELLHEYLSNQMQVMRFYNVSSRPENVTSDVPQLSILGPHLFCIFY